MDAEARFRARLAELGATLLDTHWRGTRYSYRIRCKNGHESTPTATTLVYHENAGVCRQCAALNNPHNVVRTARSRQAFLDRLAAEGVVLLEEKWLGSDAVHRIRCAQGHETTIRPQALTRFHYSRNRSKAWQRSRVCVPCKIEEEKEKKDG
jgi:hypothetical protein